MDRTLSLKLAPIAEIDYDRIVEIGRNSATALGDRWSFTKTDVVAMLAWTRLGRDGFFCVRDEGTIVGMVRYLRFLDASPRQILAQITVDPDFRRDGIGRWVYEQVWERAKADGAEILDSMADGRDKDSIGFLSRRGFEKLIQIWTMQADPDFAPQEAPAVPRGYRLRDYRLGEDTALLTDLYNRTFDRHVSFFTSTVEDTRSIENTPMFDSKLTVFLETEQGQVVAYARNSVREEVRDAWVDVLGVLPEYQGKGLGRFMLLHSLYLLAQSRPKAIRLIVEGSNDRARALYDSEGFMEVCTRIRFRKTLA